MLFEVHDKKLKKVQSGNFASELEVESYLISAESTESILLNAEIFKEELLLIDNQTTTKANKRADILALDKQGNLVVIELKKDNAKLGVEMQALQYLADFSEYKGKDFLDRFKQKNENIEDAIKGFIDLEIEKLNQHARIILIAQSFDNSLLSMGEWLSNQGVAFRCLQYSQIKIDNRNFLSFSVYFDRANSSIFPLRFSGTRQSSYSELPQVYWHNIGNTDDQEAWWANCINSKFIATSFENAPGDRGEMILKSFIEGDRVIAYANGYGAIGWGIINNPKSYELIHQGSDKDYAGRGLRHRLNIEWQSTLKLENGISAKVLKETYQVYPPIQTSSTIKSVENANKLIESINAKSAETPIAK